MLKIKLRVHLRNKIKYVNVIHTDNVSKSIHINVFMYKT